MMYHNSGFKTRLQIKNTGSRLCYPLSLLTDAPMA